MPGISANKMWLSPAFVRAALIVVMVSVTDASLDRKSRPIELQKFTWKCVKGGRCVRSGSRVSTG
jgi:hypothetical protein